MSDDGVVRVPPLDLARLQAWAGREVPGFGGQLHAERIVAGNSNPIWRLDAGGRRYVLRTQPAGVLLKSAHALDREVRVLRALAGQVPVPSLRAACDDAGVIGVGFYLMDWVDGEVHRNPQLPGLAPAQRRAIFDAAIDAFVQVHALDVDAIGLRDFGRPGHYFQRQLHRWTQQYRSALPAGEPTMDTLIAALERALPADDEPAVLLHGDARLDNLMWRRGSAQLAAMFDWELSTLGHPLADLGQFLAVQALPADYGLPGLAGVDLAALGIPGAAEQAGRYFARSGRRPRDLRPYLGFAMFRQAAMSAGLKRRADDGTAVNETARYFGDTMDVFARTGLELLHGEPCP